MSLPRSKNYDLKTKKPIHTFASVGLIIALLFSAIDIPAVGFILGVVVTFGAYFFQNYIDFYFIYHYRSYAKLPRILSGNKKE